MRHVLGCMSWETRSRIGEESLCLILTGECFNLILTSIEKNRPIKPTGIYTEPWVLWLICHLVPISTHALVIPVDNSFPPLPFS